MDILGLQEMDVITEIDDVHVARMMTDELRGCHKDMRMWVLAKWVARLRETYVAVGEELWELKKGS